MLLAVGPLRMVFVHGFERVPSGTDCDRWQDPEALEERVEKRGEGRLADDDEKDEEEEHDHDGSQPPLLVLS